MNLGVSAAVVDGQLIEGDVTISDGLINAVGVPGARGSDIALPGFIDVHTHGYRGVDFALASEIEMKQASDSLPETGVTSFQPTILTMEIGQMESAASVHAQSSYQGARFLGSHLEGPFLSPEYPGAHQPDLLLGPDVAITGRLLASGDIAQVTMAPELAGSMEVIEFLVDSGVRVALGHSSADVAEANRAFESGAVAVTHIFNALRPMGHRDPGIVGASLSNPDVFITAIFDGVHLSKEISTVILRAAGQKLVAVTDAMAAAGSGDGKYSLGNRVVLVEDGEARLVDGTIASSVLTMDAAFRNLVDLGLSLCEASNATSTAPAALSNRPELGVLTPGTVADVVVVDSSLFPTRALVGGIEVFPL